MDIRETLIQLLEDTRQWASIPENIDLENMYSSWSSQTELLNQLDEHIADAKNESADFTKLTVLYAPTAGLCEILTTNKSANEYMRLASKFDALLSQARPKV